MGTGIWRRNLLGRDHLDNLGKDRSFLIKVFLENNGRGLDSFDLGTGPVTGCCETG